MDFAPRRRVSPTASRTEHTQLTVQRKLQVGSSKDPLEHEADVVANEVMRHLAADERSTDDRGVAAPAASTRIRRRADEGTAADSFQAPPEVERGIAAARGGGAAMDARVRSRYEGAMGVDLGGVRVHTDGQADALNRSVSAKAFTTGNDVFFSKGAYNPSSGDGQRLLAHELAHTVQQGGSARRTMNRSTIRRMSVDGTDFSTTTDVNVFQKGGSGNVAEFTDGGTSIIVKVDQLIGNEVVAAGNLISGANALDGESKSKGDKGKGFEVKAPKSRIATPAELQAIKVAAHAHMRPGAKPRNFLTGLDSPNPTIIAEKMGGEDFDKVLQGTHTVTDKKGKVKADPDSILFQMVSGSGPMTALARAGVPDITMGMGDRIMGLWNPQNFKYDASNRTFNFIDNTQNIGHGFITTVELGRGMTHTSQAAFGEWTRNGRVSLLKSDIPKLAEQLFATVTGYNNTGGILGDVEGDADLHRLLLAALTKNHKKIKGYIENGFKTGLQSVLSQLANPLRLANGVPEAKRLEVVQSMLAKGYFYKGMAADAAWTKAGTEAAKLVPPSRPTTAPPTNAPQQVPQQPTGGAKPASWKNAVVPGRSGIKIGSKRG